MQNRRNFLITAAFILTGLAGCVAKPLQPAQPSPPEATEPPVEEPRPLLRVALLSDPHTVAADSDLASGINGKLVDAVNDLAPLKPDLWVVNGDIANGGQRAELEAFKEIMAKVAGTETLLVTTGNHDFYDSEADDAEERRRFIEVFNLPTPYTSRVEGDLHIVMLATEQWKSGPGPREWAWLSSDQIQWFERVLAEHPDHLP
jgi:3',5'-cyclic AMP phosphodiesterase CpdA